MAILMREMITSLCFFMLVDGLSISQARHLLLDFLCGSTSRHKYKKIHKSQTVRDRLLLIYIKSYIRYESDSAIYKKYLRLYLIKLFSMLPQYTVLIICFLFFNGIPLRIVVVVLGLVNLMLCWVFRAPSWPGWISPYAKKPGNRKK